MQTVSLRARSLSTSLFLKTLLALSGAGWFFFVINHLYSNLHIFAGRESFNAYYEGLNASPGILWSIRFVLLAGFLVHVGTSIVITRRSVESRPQRYRMKRDVVTTYAARTMRWTGPIVGLYIVYHVLHLTVGVAMPEGLERTHDYYGNVVRSFQVPWVAAFYVLANGALAVHLAHGASSLFQTLGLTEPALDRARHIAAVTVALLMCAGFASMPIAVWAGVLTP